MKLPKTVLLAAIIIILVLCVVACSSEQSATIPDIPETVASSVSATVQAVTKSSIAASAQTRTASVRRVIDGDTIEVDIGGSSHTIRYIGVDTPETKHPQKGWSVLDLKPLSSTSYW